jgi:hypothetical protein
MEKRGPGAPRIPFIVANRSSGLLVSENFYLRQKIIVTVLSIFYSPLKNDEEPALKMEQGYLKHHSRSAGGDWIIQLRMKSDEQ